MINGHAHRLALGSSDAITLAQLTSATRSTSCCARITRNGKTGWCTLPEGHWPATDHEGVLSAPEAPTAYGPRGRR